MKIDHLKSLCSKETWVFIFLALISIFFLAHFTNLSPKVDNEFFFSSDDPQFQSEHLISHLFVRKDAQLIISANGDINSKEYQSNIEKLSTTLTKIPGIIGVKSITHGPSDLKDAQNSPLWKRLLLSHDQQSTNLIVIIKEENSSETVRYIEQVMSRLEQTSFKLKASGLPYVVELIRRYLIRDIVVFSSIAFLLFGIVIFVIFRSKGILFGTMLTCTCACIWTFMITDLANIPVGLLTANLATIVFVLTLSHIVFLTFNWIEALESHLTKIDSVNQAVKVTFAASFWSMVTTFLGFLSLLSVPAKPLRDLGAAGAIGTVVAIAVAYTIFPAFLRIVKHLPTVDHSHNSKTKKAFAFLEKRRSFIAWGLVLLTLFAIPGLFKINTDPSLLSYFSKKSELYDGLSYIDKNGGSSPLITVVRLPDNKPLNSNQSYEQLWKLQQAYEQHRSVGSVISLPVLMAEAKQEPLAFFLKWEWLLDIMEQPQYDAIAKSFVTSDRKFGLFLLRMNELNRSKERLEILDEIEDIVENQGFILEIMGGVYKLQGHMAKLVASSLIFGLAKLIGLFAVISLIISRSVKIALAMTLSITMMPICILGFIGLYGIPLDIISAPASNIAIAIGIDSMIHLVQAFKRSQKNNNNTTWHDIRLKLSRPIFTSMFVIVTGFGIFFFSTFPPTQRFGTAIVFGSIVAAFIAIFNMPLLAEKLSRK